MCKTQNRLNSTQEVNRRGYECSGVIFEIVSLQNSVGVSIESSYRSSVIASVFVSPLHFRISWKTDPVGTRILFLKTLVQIVQLSVKQTAIQGEQEQKVKLLHIRYCWLLNAFFTK